MQKLADIHTYIHTHIGRACFREPEQVPEVSEAETEARAAAQAEAANSVARAHAAEPEATEADADAAELLHNQNGSSDGEG